MYNACLSHDGTKVVCDYGTYHLTGAELANPEGAVIPGAIKCREAHDSGWATRRKWDDKLTADVIFQDAPRYFWLGREADRLELNQD